MAGPGDIAEYDPGGGEEKDEEEKKGRKWKKSKWVGRRFKAAGRRGGAGPIARGKGTNWMGFLLIFIGIVVISVAIIAGTGGWFGEIPLIGTFLKPFETVFTTNPILNRFVSQYGFATDEGGGFQNAMSSIFGPVLNPQAYIMEQQAAWNPSTTTTVGVVTAPPNLAFEIVDFSAHPENMQFTSSDNDYCGTALSFKVRNTGEARIEKIDFYLNSSASLKDIVFGFQFLCGGGWTCCNVNDNSPPCGTSSTNCYNVLAKRSVSNIEEGGIISEWCDELEFSFGTVDVNEIKGSAQKVTLIAQTYYSARAYIAVQAIEKEYAQTLLKSDKLKFRIPSSVSSRGAAKIYMSTEDQPIMVERDKDGEAHLKVGIVDVGIGEIKRAKEFVLSIPSDYVFSGTFESSLWAEIICVGDGDNTYERCEACYRESCCETLDKEEVVLTPEIRKSLCYIQSGDFDYTNYKYTSALFDPESDVNIVCEAGTRTCEPLTLELNMPAVESGFRKTALIRADFTYLFEQRADTKVFMPVM